MTTVSEIQAGRAAISVVLDDSGIQPQLTSLSARLKAASAGLAAATLPTMAGEAIAPGREYATAADKLQQQFDAGLRSPREFTAELDKLQAQLAATATPVQALGLQFARLDADLARGAISQAEYQRQMTALAAEFTATANPIDRLQGQIVALDRDVWTGAISESEYRSQLSALHREFVSAAGPVDRYAAEIATLDAQLKRGEITQKHHTAAVERAKAALARSAGSPFARAADGVHEARSAYDALAASAVKVGASHMGAIPGVSGLTNVLSEGHPVLIAVAAATVGVVAAYKLVSGAAEYYTSQVRAQLEELDALQAKAEMLGVTVQVLREMSAAAKEVGEVEPERFEQGLGKLTQTIGEAAAGSKTAEAAFASLGLRSRDLANQTPTEALLRVADALARVEQPAERARLANDLFGRGARDLIPLLQSGRQAIEESAAAYRQYAGSISAEQVQAISDQDKAWGRVRASIAGIAATAAADLAPVLTVAAERVAELLDPKTSEGQTLRMALEVVPPLLAHIIDLTDLMVGHFQLGQAAVMGLANAAVQAAATADRALAAITPGRGPSEELQQMAADYQRQTELLAKSAAERIDRGLSGRASQNVEGAAEQARARAKGTPQTAGDVGATAAAAESAGVPPAGEPRRVEVALPPPQWMTAAEQLAASVSGLDAATNQLAEWAASTARTVYTPGLVPGDPFAALAVTGGGMESYTFDDWAAEQATAQESATRAAEEFAAAMEASSERLDRTLEEKAQTSEGRLQARIDDLRRQKEESDLERRARAAVEGPRESVAGTFSGYRLGAQFGTADRTPQQQLEEARHATRVLQRLLEVTERQPDPVYG